MLTSTFALSTNEQRSLWPQAGGFNIVVIIDPQSDESEHEPASAFICENRFLWLEDGTCEGLYFIKNNISEELWEQKRTPTSSEYFEQYLSSSISNAKEERPKTEKMVEALRNSPYSKIVLQLDSQNEIDKDHLRTYLSDLTKLIADMCPEITDEFAVYLALIPSEDLIGDATEAGLVMPVACVETDDQSYLGENAQENAETLAQSILDKIPGAFLQYIKDIKDGIVWIDNAKVFYGIEKRQLSYEEEKAQLTMF